MKAKPKFSVTVIGMNETDSCKWFLSCENAATRTRPHPILGDVPICERCNAKMDRIGGKAAD